MFVNRDEAAILGGGEALRAAGARVAIVKLGACEGVRPWEETESAMRRWPLKSAPRNLR